MKTLFVLCLFAVAVYANDGDLYDKVDMLKLVADDEQRTGAFNCLMDRGPCDKYELIKDAVPRILKSSCGDCNPSQKDVYEKTVKYLEKNHHDLFKELLTKFA